MSTDYTHDELMNICNNMQKYGGSFSASLAKSFINADNSNRRKLIEAFPEFFKKKSVPGIYTTEVAIIELEFNEKTLEEVLKIIAEELYKDSRHRRFFGRISGILKSESVLSFDENSQKPKN